MEGTEGRVGKKKGIKILIEEQKGEGIESTIRQGGSDYDTDGLNHHRIHSRG